MKYVYRPNAKFPSVHILNDSGLVVCTPGIKADKGSRYVIVEDKPSGTRMCRDCEANSYVGPKLNKKQKRHLKRVAKRVRDNFYASWEWKKLRYEVLKAYGAICMLCNSTEFIVVDHIKPRSKYPHLQLEFENMQVLCNSCNKGKGAWDETDFRPKCPEPELSGPELSHMKSITLN